jgi:hypothetical protein
MEASVDFEEHVIQMPLVAGSRRLVKRKLLVSRPNLRHDSRTAL